MVGIIFPPLPAFYHLPKTIDEVIDHSVVRMLELVGIDVSRPSWQGLVIQAEA